MFCVAQIRGRLLFPFFFSSRRRHTRCSRDWSSDVCSSDLGVYRDLSGNTPVLDCVRRAEQAVLAAQTTKSYVAAAGREEFNRAVEEMVLGPAHTARRDRRART